jgi:hypothetical protein
MDIKTGGHGDTEKPIYYNEELTDRLIFKRIMPYEI